MRPLGLLLRTKRSRVHVNHSLAHNRTLRTLNPSQTVSTQAPAANKDGEKKNESSVPCRLIERTVLSSIPARLL